MWQRQVVFFIFSNSSNIGKIEDEIGKFRDVPGAARISRDILLRQLFREVTNFISLTVSGIAMVRVEFETPAYRFMENVYFNHNSPFFACVLKFHCYKTTRIESQIDEFCRKGYN